MKNQHWADVYADRIIRERTQYDSLTCASGITPSGTVHIGNFREIISVELVVRALKDKGANPRFIYSWDDFDVFRKIPQNIPSQEEFKKYLRMPIVDIPDPWDRAESFALANEREIEGILSRFGIFPSYIYQSQAYRNASYVKGIQKALTFKEQIIEILNFHRTTPLEDDWWPVSIFSEFTNKDTTKIISWDGEWKLTYYCEDSQQEAELDIRSSKGIKLLWRIDWPMRWDYEKVVFEPAGKDHHSHGGSFDTAKAIVTQVYGYEPPVTFQYGFIQVKGGSGKLSSSSGEVVGVDDMLRIYQAELIRYIFASTRPNVDFAISFDLDVIKLYEDYDRCERIYFGLEEVGEARKEKEARIYELSQIHTAPSTMPLQIPFRHLCNLLQIYAGDTEQVLDSLYNEFGKENIEHCKDYLLSRMSCAWNWIQEFAPEEFKFCLNEHIDASSETKEQGLAIQYLREFLASSWDEFTDKDINAKIYDAARESHISPQDFFIVLYNRIVGKSKGPRLGTFFKVLGKEKVLKYLK